MTIRNVVLVAATMFAALALGGVVAYEAGNRTTTRYVPVTTRVPVTTYVPVTTTVVQKPNLPTSLEAADIVEAGIKGQHEGVDVTCVASDSTSRHFDCLSYYNHYDTSVYYTFTVVCDELSCQWDAREQVYPDPATN